MQDKNFYETYHLRGKRHRRLINENNFTYRNLLKIVSIHLSEKINVLDVGCGTGAIDFYLSSKVNDILGLDISSLAIKNAVQNAKALDIAGNIEFRTLNFLNFKTKKKFDLILCFEILEHLRNDGEAVKKVFNLSKRGGVAIFSVPSENSPLFKLGFAKKHDMMVGHLRRYSADELSTLIKAQGFRIIKVQKNEGVLRNALFIFPIGNLIIKVANRFDWVSNMITIFDNFLSFFGESQIIVVAKKPI